MVWELSICCSMEIPLFGIFLGGRGHTIPGVCVRVANKGVARQGVRKSGRQRTYRKAFLRECAMGNGRAGPKDLRAEKTRRSATWNGCANETRLRSERHKEYYHDWLYLVNRYLYR